MHGQIPTIFLVVGLRDILEAQFVLWVEDIKLHVPREELSVSVVFIESCKNWNLEMIQKLLGFEN